MSQADRARRIAARISRPAMFEAEVVGGDALVGWTVLQASRTDNTGAETPYYNVWPLTPGTVFNVRSNGAPGDMVRCIIITPHTGRPEHVPIVRIVSMGGASGSSQPATPTPSAWYQWRSGQLAQRYAQPSTVPKFAGQATTLFIHRSAGTSNILAYLRIDGKYIYYLEFVAAGNSEAEGWYLTRASYDFTTVPPQRLFKLPGTGTATPGSGNEYPDGHFTLGEDLPASMATEISEGTPASSPAAILAFCTVQAFSYNSQIYSGLPKLYVWDNISQVLLYSGALLLQPPGSPFVPGEAAILGQPVISKNTVLVPCHLPSDASIITAEAAGNEVVTWQGGSFWALAVVDAIAQIQEFFIFQDVPALPDLSGTIVSAAYAEDGSHIILTLNGGDLSELRMGDVITVPFNEQVAGNGGAQGPSVGSHQILAVSGNQVTVAPGNNNPPGPNDVDNIWNITSVNQADTSLPNGWYDTRNAVCLQEPPLGSVRPIQNTQIVPFDSNVYNSTDSLALRGSPTNAQGDGCLYIFAQKGKPGITCVNGDPNGNYPIYWQLRGDISRFVTEYYTPILITPNDGKLLVYCVREETQSIAGIVADVTGLDALVVDTFESPGSSCATLYVGGNANGPTTGTTTAQTQWANWSLPGFVNPSPSGFGGDAYIQDVVSDQAQADARFRAFLDLWNGPTGAPWAGVINNLLTTHFGFRKARTQSYRLYGNLRTPVASTLSDSLPPTPTLDVQGPDIAGYNGIITVTETVLASAGQGRVPVAIGDPQQFEGGLPYRTVLQDSGFLSHGETVTLEASFTLGANEFMLCFFQLIYLCKGSGIPFGGGGSDTNCFYGGSAGLGGQVGGNGIVAGGINPSNSAYYQLKGAAGNIAASGHIPGGGVVLTSITAPNGPVDAVGARPVFRILWAAIIASKTTNTYTTCTTPAWDAHKAISDTSGFYLPPRSGNDLDSTIQHVQPT